MKDKGHFLFSIIKSVLRIIGGIGLVVTKEVQLFGLLFILAEVLGIFEEIFDKR